MFAYLGAPYSHPDKEVREARFEAVTTITALLMKLGMVVYSPITHCHIVANNHNLPGDWSFWKPVNKVFLKHCSALLVLQLPDWSASEGLSKEINLAIELGKPVIYLNPLFHILGTRKEDTTNANMPEPIPDCSTS